MRHNALNTRSMPRLTLTLCIAFFLGGRAIAGEPLRDSLSDVAVQIQKVLELEGADAVSLGVIVPANGDGVASYGRRIAEFLRLELEHQNVLVPQNANLRLKGEYFLDPASGTITVTVTVVDKLGKTVSAIATGAVDASLLETEVKDSAEVLLVSHTSIAIEPSPTLNIEKVVEKLETPESNDLRVEDGYLVLHGLELGMRLREVNPRYPSRHPEFLGRIIAAKSPRAPHFTLEKDRSYAIELKSYRSDIDFANKVLFDGIDTFALSDDQSVRISGGRRVPIYENWVLTRNSSQLILGWFNNLNEVSAFQIVPDELSVAHRLGAPDGIGTIQVVAYAAWPKGENVDSRFRNNVLGVTPKGGGIGKSLQVDLTSVDIEKGVILGAICAEYTER